MIYEAMIYSMAAIALVALGLVAALALVATYAPEWLPGYAGTRQKSPLDYRATVRFYDESGGVLYSTEIGATFIGKGSWSTSDAITFENKTDAAVWVARATISAPDDLSHASGFELGFGGIYSPIKIPPGCSLTYDFGQHGNVLLTTQHP